MISIFSLQMQIRFENICHGEIVAEQNNLSLHSILNQLIEGIPTRYHHSLDERKETKTDVCSATASVFCANRAYNYYSSDVSPSGSTPRFNSNAYKSPLCQTPTSRPRTEALCFRSIFLNWKIMYSCEVFSLALRDRFYIIYKYIF